MGRTDTDKSGVLTHTYDGCDSVHTLTVTINNSDATSSSVTACDTYTWEGQTLTTSGVLTHTYTNASGCDGCDSVHASGCDSVHFNCNHK